MAVGTCCPAGPAQASASCQFSTCATHCACARPYELDALLTSTTTVASGYSNVPHMTPPPGAIGGLQNCGAYLVKANATGRNTYVSA